MVEKIADAAVGVELMIHGHINHLDITIRGKYLSDMIFVDILGELLDDNFGALESNWTSTSCDTSARTVGDTSSPGSPS